VSTTLSKFCFDTLHIDVENYLCACHVCPKAHESLTLGAPQKLDAGPIVGEEVGLDAESMVVSCCCDLGEPAGGPWLPHASPSSRRRPDLSVSTPGERTGGGHLLHAVDPQSVAANTTNRSPCADLCLALGWWCEQTRGPSDPAPQYRDFEGGPVDELLFKFFRKKVHRGWRYSLVSMLDMMALMGRVHQCCALTIVLALAQRETHRQTRTRTCGFRWWQS
jgi:hypothetical protein